MFPGRRDPDGQGPLASELDFPSCSSTWVLRSAISEPCGRPKPYEARVVCGNLTDRVQDPVRCCNECGRISGVPQSRFRFLAYSYHTWLTTHSPGQYRAGIHPLPFSSMRRGPPSAYGSHALTWQGRAPTTDKVAAPSIQEFRLKIHRPPRIEPRSATKRLGIRLRRCPRSPWSSHC